MEGALSLSLYEFSVLCLFIPNLFFSKYINYYYFILKIMYIILFIIIRAHTYLNTHTRKQARNNKPTQTYKHND